MVPAMTQTPASCGCSLKLILHIIDCVVLLLVLVIQGSILDYYLILHNGGSAGWYFWFFADFLILIVFMAAGVISFRYYQKKTRQRQDDGTTEIDSIVFPISKMGILPLSYVIWLFYAILLMCKVVILFKLDVAQRLDEESTFGPQLLKVIIAASAIVFLLLVEIHSNLDSNSEHQAYIKYLTTATVFEIFDTVTFLGILFPNVTKVLLTFSLENAILGLSCCNFLLPSLALYKLSRSEFGLRPRSLGLSLLYKLLHMGLVNIPYLVIRIYLWTVLDHDVSLFLLKNILSLIIVVRTTIPDVQLWYRLWQENYRKQHSRLEGGMELSVVCGRNDGDNMEVVRLNDKRPPESSQL